ncbi:hypothetical protein SAY86_013829 [Trapa natans]|uniref:Uncharacterized protein n=1 Tax=Trapa natans TaxID=22666 RepID=A0AAN7QM68_TRANT|nr:hypothetical protein SAY86_013829 [Trapa natans]
MLIRLSEAAHCNRWGTAEWWVRSNVRLQLPIQSFLRNTYLCSDISASLEFRVGSPLALLLLCCCNSWIVAHGQPCDTANVCMIEEKGGYMLPMANRVIILLFVLLKRMGVQKVAHVHFFLVCYMVMRD